MKRFTAALALLVTTCLLPIETFAQRVSTIRGTDEQIIIVDKPGGNQFSDSYEIYSWDEYFGEHADAMKNASDAAFERMPDDQFKWSKKIPYDKTNSCSDAALNLVDYIETNQVMPEGWKVRTIGTLGTKTTAFNHVGENYDRVRWSIRDKEWRSVNEWDKLDPQSYAHSLTIARAPDGTFFTLDNWIGNTVKIKKVYPLDAEETFFSEDPNETDYRKAPYRRSKTDTRPWDFEDKLAERDRLREQQDSPIPPTSDEVEVDVLASHDPNDKLGNRGVGAVNYITPDGLMHYVIRFENMPDATAPAQEVLIRDTLDTRVLDLSTFMLGDIAFSDRIIPVPAGLTTFTTRVPLGDDRHDVLISGNLVRATGIATWRFTTLDVQTDDLPFDPLDGFLPPNRDAPEGEGSVSFSINLLEELAHDTEIRNEARIYFDLNEPIDTPPWINRLDLVPPTSSVTGLEPVQSDTLFTVRWGGADPGSGIRGYHVFFSVNGGEFERWLTNYPGEEADFAGRPDSTYAFFSIAYDAVGNMEPMKDVADAFTIVSNDSDAFASDMPTTFALQQNYPNPFNPSTTIKYAVPQAAHVRITIYDVLGRRIEMLVDEQRVPGWYEVQWDARRLASGSYFYRMEAGDFVHTRQLLLVK